MCDFQFSICLYQFERFLEMLSQKRLVCQKSLTAESLEKAELGGEVEDILGTVRGISCLEISSGSVQAACDTGKVFVI